MSTILSREKENWDKRLSSLITRVEELESLDSKGELLKKWGIAGYLKVDMNEDNINTLKGELEGLEQKRSGFKKNLEDAGDHYVSPDQKTGYLNILNGLQGRIHFLEERIKNKLGMVSELELSELQKQLQSSEDAKKVRREVEENIRSEREKSYNQKFNTGLISLLATKIPLDPLTATEAEALARKQKVFDAMRIEKELCDRNIINIQDKTKKGLLSLIKQGLLTGQQAGAALITGASEMTSELYNLGINRAIMFLAWPLALPFKVANIVVLTPLKWIFTASSVFVDETLNKGLWQPAKNWFMNFSWKESSTGDKAVRILAALPLGVLGLVTGVVVLSGKALAGFFEGAKKYINWDWLVKNKPDFSMIAGGIGGPIMLIATLALLIAAPFTFGVSGLLLVGLWAGFGVSVGAGLGLAVKNARDATKAELSLELPPEQTIQLMDYEHRTNKRIEQEERSKNVTPLKDVSGLERDGKSNRPAAQAADPSIQSVTKLGEELGALSEKQKVQIAAEASSKPITVAAGLDDKVKPGEQREYSIANPKAPVVPIVGPDHKDEKDKAPKTKPDSGRSS